MLTTFAYSTNTLSTDLGNKVADNTTVINTHSWAVRVEDASDSDLQKMSHQHFHVDQWSNSIRDANNLDTNVLQRTIPCSYHLTQTGKLARERMDAQDFSHRPTCIARVILYST